MLGHTKARHTKGAIQIVVGGSNPQTFFVPKKAAESVIELLRPYDVSNATVAAEEVFAGVFKKNGKAGTVSFSRRYDTAVACSETRRQTGRRICHGNRTTTDW
jgi:hypothetical protein